MNMNEHVKVLGQMYANGFDHGFDNEQYAALNAAIDTLKALEERCQAPQRPESGEATVTVRYDLSPSATEGATRDKLVEMGWTPPDGRDVAAKAVAWARPVYAAEAAEPFDKGDLVDVEFHNRAEKPEGEGWRPLVFADTGAKGGLAREI